MVSNATRRYNDTFSSPDAGFTGPGEYAPAGEAQGVNATFSAAQVAHAFDIDVDRVHHAMKGELGLGPDDEVTSRQAQQLVEVLLTDRSVDLRQAALMNLGAFTPRTDHEWGFGETAPGDEGDRLKRRGDQPDEERRPMEGWVDDE